MLDDHHGVASIAQLPEQLQQQRGVVEVKAGGGFVEQVEGLARLSLAQLACKLDALGLATREGCRTLAQLQIAQAHLGQGVEPSGHGRNGCEELPRLFNREAQHLGNGLAPVADV